jgi:hypothetical protein
LEFEKLIFLDIDGVLITGVYNNKFDPTSVSLFNRLIQETGAKVVISSSRRYVGVEKLTDFFVKHGVICDIIDITPIGFEFQNRGEEIDCWLRENGMPDKFCIIDDNTNRITDYFFNSFVKTESKIGFDEVAYSLAYKILT